MINLRREAEGRECTVMIPNVCNHNPETTVLAYVNIRSVFMCGMSQKPPDMFGAWACSACHDAYDRRTSWSHKDTYISPTEIDMLFLEGVFRTQNI